MNRGKYYIDKDVQIWVDQKMLKNVMKNKVIYNISKDQSSKIG